ncbi:MAG TPA: DUF58 domain-containing protein [Woeseiaceae bacterium]|nr:DUF58 domain-containing protein [Woeseiaceae bacterium]
MWNESLISIPVWRIAVALLALGLIYEWVVVSRNQPAVRLIDGLQLKLGVDSQLDLAFLNTGSRRIKIDYAAALPAGLTGSREIGEVTASPVAEVIDKVPVRGVELGTRNWRHIPARVLGPLGLARWSRNLPLDARINVYPDTLGESRRKSSSSPQGAEARALIGGGMELHHLRQYRRGDARNAIDWKATARSGELVTRVFGEDQHLEILIAVDAGRMSRIQFDGMSQLSHYVNLAARFAEYAVIAEDRAGLVVFADRILRTVSPRRGLDGVQQVRKALHDLTPRAVESNLVQAALRIRSLARHRSLVILLTDLYDRDAHSQLARCTQLLLPKHLPVIVGIQSDEVAALAERTASSWFDPYKSLAAREYNMSVNLNVARLRRMGAYTVIARPRELDDRVISLYEKLRSKRLI